MAKKPDELLALVKPWGIEEETKKYMAKYFAAKGETVDIDSWIRDRRTAEQFGQQMKAFWAVEDAFSVWLERNLRRKYPKATVKISGSDQNRTIVQGQSPKGKVTGALDYEVDLNDGTPPTQVEFQFSTTELDAYDVKKNKVTRAERQNGVILFAFLPIKKFTILSPSFIKENGKILINSRLGGKETWNIPTEKIQMRPDDYQISKEDLQSNRS
ncbi:hypothetical protein M1403_00030 [Patescibacteria group bacterium]|nr:hypothetical protein [Patescibacteria group bacterium]